MVVHWCKYSYWFWFKYVADNGFAFSSNLVSKGAKSSSGLLTNEDEHKWDTHVRLYTRSISCFSFIV